MVSAGKLVIVEDFITNDYVDKKRKLSEQVDSSLCKIVKFYDISDVHNAQTIQKKKHNQSNVFSDNNISNNKYEDVAISLKKNTTKIEHDCEENMDIDKCKNTMYCLNDKRTMKCNLNKCSLVKEYKADFLEESENNNVKKCDEIYTSDFELGTCTIDDFNDCFEEEWSIGNEINFNSLQRCKIVDVTREYNSILLTVKQEDHGTHITTVRCSGFWKDAKVEKDDTVAIQAKKENECWTVDNSSGFLVVHPDVLISGTTVAGGLFCSRKAVLAEKFKKIEGLPCYARDQTAMVIGSLTHQLLQKAILNNIHESSDVTKLMDTILQSRETASVLYASEIPFDKCREQMLTFVPRIFEFIQHYLKDKEQQKINCIRDNFKGRITHVHDIEENIWDPKLGIKGKVDITVEVKINSNRIIMPLEVKTGKPSFSLEHKGQIILYIMMMSLTGQDTDTGLLLYLRDNTMQSINSGHSERRDLILLRNILASYFAFKSNEKSMNITSKSDLQTMELPEPINHHSACSKCPYNALCCIYLSKETKLQFSESHPLMKLSKQILGRFKSTHIDYILQWISLLQLEESAQFSDNIMRYLWTLRPEKREVKKTCICYLKVIGKVTEHNSKYRHTFVRVNSKIQITNTELPYMEFSENEYVLVSTDTRINISAGFIVNIKEDSITVLLDRNITRYSIDKFFHIDKYSSSSLFSFTLANVGGLMGDDEICEKLREIVIDRKPATFEKGLPQSIVHKSAKILQDLNETQTLVALIELLHETGHSVLITAHTNSAVDNILLKLLSKNIDFLRLGSSAHKSLTHKREGYATASCNSPDSLDAVYSSKNIIGVTCYGAHHALLRRRTFDVCLVDESTQALQPSVLRPLYSARKFVLVGDPDQLPPIIKSELARKLGADESLFARLDSKNNTVCLTKQYRMNKKIMYIANKLTYNDTLKSGNTLIENANFVTPYIEILRKEEKWVQKALSPQINDSVIILNTGCTSSLKVSCNVKAKYLESHQANSNIWEGVIVSKLIQILLKMDSKPQNIGIIAPYRAHVNLLRKIVQNDIEINTVDQYQGRDKEVIIYSCAKSLINSNDIKEDLEILGDHRRLTVAVTRAKHKLIVVADKNTLSQYSAFKKLFNLIEDKNILNLNDNCDFSWEKIESLL
ncbi:PREDICTED: DNA replication ATP-dependent helicase/nuclease DNA2 [Habropoda laboriosa]|uniref:DNA replication ATP-dependent helicase/nuclease DNA2 n=1 Tax=Habropoda laboriosa TaxID=597456 RepID=UPI00083E2C9D|nr:PREDICTED: DNA replication ATP-dependent helicase/nuclease DNA2 [Habropoda laboriosa]